MFYGPAWGPSTGVEVHQAASHGFLKVRSGDDSPVCRPGAPGLRNPSMLLGIRTSRVPAVWRYPNLTTPPLKRSPLLKDLPGERYGTGANGLAPNRADQAATFFFGYITATALASPNARYNRTVMKKYLYIRCFFTAKSESTTGGSSIRVRPAAKTLYSPG